MDKDTCDEAADKFSIITNLSPLKPSERRIKTTSKEDYNEREENTTCNREFIRTEDDMDGSKFSAGVIPTDSHLIYKSEKEPIFQSDSKVYADDTTAVLCKMDKDTCDEAADKFSIITNPSPLKSSERRIKTTSKEDYNEREENATCNREFIRTEDDMDGSKFSAGVIPTDSHLIYKSEKEPIFQSDSNVYADDTTAVLCKMDKDTCDEAADKFSIITNLSPLKPSERRIQTTSKEDYNEREENATCNREFLGTEDDMDGSKFSAGVIPTDSHLIYKSEKEPIFQSDSKVYADDTTAVLCKMDKDTCDEAADKFSIITNPSPLKSSERRIKTTSKEDYNEREENATCNREFIRTEDDMDGSKFSAGVIPTDSHLIYKSEKEPIFRSDSNVYADDTTAVLCKMDKDTCDDAADKFSIITNLSPLKPSERRIQTTSKEDYNEREENATCNREFLGTEDDMDGSKFSAGVIPTDSHLIYKSEKEPIFQSDSKVYADDTTAVLCKMDKDTCDEAADKFSIITNLSPLKPSERRIQTTSKEDYNEREENATCNREFIRTEDDMDGSKFSAGVIPTDSHLIYKSEKEPIFQSDSNVYADDTTAVLCKMDKDTCDEAADKFSIITNLSPLKPSQRRIQTTSKEDYNEREENTTCNREFIRTEDDMDSSKFSAGVIPTASHLIYKSEKKPFFQSDSKVYADDTTAVLCKMDKDTCDEAADKFSIITNLSPLKPSERRIQTTSKEDYNEREENATCNREFIGTEDDMDGSKFSAGVIPTDSH